MKIRLLFILTLISVTAFSAAAQQRRTVTNDNLEKYRQKRVAAERDLRENYERLGFPSPAELERQIEQSRTERSELAARLREEDLEKERLDLEERRVALEARNLNYQIQNQNNQPDADDYYNDYFSTYAPNGFYGFPYYGFSNYGFPGKYYKRYNRGGFGGGFRRGYGNFPRVEYRNNLPIIIPPTRYTRWGGGRRN